MPALPITAKELGRSRNRLSLRRIASVMVLPNDHKRRAKLQLRCSLEEFIDELRLGNINLTGAEAADLVEAAILLPQVSRVGQGLRLPIGQHRAVLHGMIAGRILMAALGFADAKKRVQLKPTIELAVRGKRKILSITQLTYEKTVWTGYRSVAPLWAASIIISNRNKCLKGLPPPQFFPCPLRDLDLFLVVAEELRQRGEIVKWWQSSKCVLDPDKTWKVPHGVSLPRLRSQDKETPSSDGK